MAGLLKNRAESETRYSQISGRAGRPSDGTILRAHRMSGEAQFPIKCARCIDQISSVRSHLATCAFLIAVLAADGRTGGTKRASQGKLGLPANLF